MSRDRRWQVRRRYGEPEVAREFSRVDDRDYQRYSDCRGLSVDPRDCTLRECMVIAATRECPDGAFLFAGTGLPLVACMLAAHTYAPQSIIVMESGIVGPKIEHLPISVADPRAALHCSTLSNMMDVFGGIAMRGYCTVGMLGGAECDKFGNLNSTAVEGYPSGEVPEECKRRRIRLAGSGGANPIASFADYVIAMLPHEKRRFPERCEYLTSPAGGRDSPVSGGHRWQYGLYRGTGIVVVTSLGVLRSSASSGELMLETIYPAVDEQKIYDNTGWALQRSANTRVMDAPTYEELKILRYLVDPDRIYLERPV